MKKLMISVFTLILLVTTCACSSNTETQKPKESQQQEKKLKKGIHFSDSSNEEKKAFQAEPLSAKVEENLIDWLKQDGRDFEVIRYELLKNDDITAFHYRFKKYNYEIYFYYQNNTLQETKFWFSKNDKNTNNFVNIILKTAEYALSQEDIDHMNKLIADDTKDSIQNDHYLLEYLRTDYDKGIGIKKQDASNQDQPFVAKGEPGTGMTIDLFNRIIEGMTYTQIRAIVGTEGILQAQTTQNGSTASTYLWNSSNNGAATFIFVNDRLTTKAQSGL